MLYDEHAQHTYTSINVGIAYNRIQVYEANTIVFV